MLTSVTFEAKLPVDIVISLVHKKEIYRVSLLLSYFLFLFFLQAGQLVKSRAAQSATSAKASVKEEQEDS
jgi:hypothetical protein